MNFKQFLGVDSLDRMANGTTLTHKEKYETIVNALGYEDVKRCVPFTIEQITEAIKTDEYLNDLAMSKWDMAGGFICSCGEAKLIGSELTNLYRKIGVNSYSPSDSVCILKACARMMVEEKQK